MASSSNLECGMGGSYKCALSRVQFHTCLSNTLTGAGKCYDIHDHDNDGFLQGADWCRVQVWQSVCVFWKEWALSCGRWKLLTRWFYSLHSDFLGFLLFFLLLICAETLLAFAFLTHRSWSTTFTMPTAGFTLIFLLLQRIFILGRGWRLLRWPRDWWMSRNSFDDVPQCWIAQLTTIAIILFYSFRFLLSDVNAIAVKPLFAVITTDHEPRRVTTATNTVSDILIL